MIVCVFHFECVLDLRSTSKHPNASEESNGLCVCELSAVYISSLCPKCCVRFRSQDNPSSQLPLLAAPWLEAVSAQPDCRSGVKLKHTLYKHSSVFECIWVIQSTSKHPNAFEVDKCSMAEMKALDLSFQGKKTVCKSDLRLLRYGHFHVLCHWMGLIPPKYFKGIKRIQCHLLFCPFKCANRKTNVLKSSAEAAYSHKSGCHTFVTVV